MKFVWVDEGNDPDWEKCERHEIGGYFWAVQDPRVTKAYLQAAKPRAKVVGVYAAWNWPDFDGKEPEAQADRLHEMVSAVSWHPASSPKVQWNDERHEPDKIIRVLERFRQLEPTSDLSWTLEGHQSGWMSAAFIARLLACKVRVVPQLYSGDMSRVYDSLGEARNLVKRGIPDGVISPFYDAARLPEWWDGFAFTMGRLP